MAPRAAAPAAITSRLKRKRDSGTGNSAVPAHRPVATSTLEINESEDEAAGGSASGSHDEESNEETFPEIDEEDSDDVNSAADDGEVSEGSGEGSYLIEDSDFVDSVDSEEEDPEDKPINTGPKGKTVLSKVTGRPKRVYPEIEPDYDSDSSIEEVCVAYSPFRVELIYSNVQDPNRIGNVPMHWYDDLPHIGYDIDGKKVLKPAKGDELDKFLSTVDDPSSW